MEHRGEVIKKAVYKSGYKIIKLAADMKKSRTWVYKLFETPNVSFDIIKEIGVLINYDFSNDFRGLSTSPRAPPPPFVLIKQSDSPGPHQF